MIPGRAVIKLRNLWANPLLPFLSYVYMRKKDFYTRDIVFIFSLQFQIVSNAFRAHALKKLFIKCTLQFQIVLNTVRMHALVTLFLKLSLKFQNIISNSNVEKTTCLS